MEQVSVVIPAYNDAETLKETLHSILDQEYDAPVEIIVVDDCSQDDTPEVVRSFQEHGVKCIRHERNLGLAKSVNDGVKAAKHGYVLIIQDDIVLPHKMWLKNMVSCIAKDQRIAAVTAPSIVKTYENWGFWEKALFSWEILWSREVERKIKTGEVKQQIADYTPVKNDVWRKDVFLKIGGMDETFRTACEDVNLSQRARRMGYKIVSIPDPTIHLHSSHATGLSTILLKKNPSLSEGQGVLFRRYRFRMSNINNQLFKTAALISLAFPLARIAGGIYILAILGMNAIQAFKVLRDPRVFLAVPPVKLADFILDVIYFWKGVITGRQRR